MQQTMLLLLHLLMLASLQASSGSGILFGSSCTQQFTEEPHNRCAFPSRGPQGYINECRPGTGGWWCPTTHNYCIDGAFHWCPDTQTTYGGNDPGRECRLPFWYKGVEYRHCVKLDTRGENYLWCSTTPGNYTGKWTRCRQLPALMPCRFSSTGADSSCVRLASRSGLWSCRTALGDVRTCEETPTTEGGNDPGRPCRFPFRFAGEWRSTCLSSSHRSSSSFVADNATADEAVYEWCATTDNFDRDRLWTRCKQPEPSRLSGVHQLLIAAAALVTAACTAACLLYCLCEPAAPCRRCCCCFRRGRREVAGERGKMRTTAAAAAAAAAAARSSNQQQQRELARRVPLTPTAPPLSQPREDEPVEDRLVGLWCPPPTYEEVLALTAIFGEKQSGQLQQQAATSACSRETPMVPV